MTLSAECRMNVDSLAVMGRALSGIREHPFLARTVVEQLEHDGFWLNRPTHEFAHLAPLLSAEARLLAKADAGRGRIANGSAQSAAR